MTARADALQAPSSTSDWAVLTARAPQLAATMRRYLDQQAVTLAPSTITAADRALRVFGLWVCDHDPTVRGITDIERRHVEDYKVHCHQSGTTSPVHRWRPTRSGNGCVC